MAFTDPVTLEGRLVTLEPLSRAYQRDLEEAVRDRELWKLWYTSVPAPEALGAEIDRRLDLWRKGSMLPLTVIEKSSGQAVGMTTFMNIDEKNRRLEIGSTWYRRRVQRSGINTECKLLLLTHAFEVLGCLAVEFRTHFFNRESRAGIERLGAKLDGILRQHLIGPDGTLRDTCVYSILDREWLTVRTHLAYQLSKPRG